MTGLLAAMNRGIYEKESEIALSLLAALAGESIILLGPPGVGKSMVARRLRHAFRDAKGFEYLMSRFSTPDEIFGPVSIAKLKTSDEYERSVEGYLPTADVVFLDEIWKAGPAIQNTLLTVINEKTFRNGRHEIRLPLKLLVAASNELPACGEGLEALWDRFIIRLESHGIRSEKKFSEMLLSTDYEPDISIDESIQITHEEYERWQRDINAIEVDDEVMTCVSHIRHALSSLAIDSGGERREVYVSDRRWKNIIRLVRASAFMQDRTQADVADLLPMYHCLWQEPDERDAVRTVVIRSIFSTMRGRLDALRDNLEHDIAEHNSHLRRNPSTPRLTAADDGKRLFSDYYYRLADHGTGRTFIVADDYRRLPSTEGTLADGILFADQRNDQYSIIRLYTGGRAPVGSRPVTLCRDRDHVFVDGKPYLLEQKPAAAPQPRTGTEGNDSRQTWYYENIDRLADDIRHRETLLSQGLFLSDDDRQALQSFLKEFYREVAFVRQDVGNFKLYIIGVNSSNSISSK